MDNDVFLILRLPEKDEPLPKMEKCVYCGMLTCTQVSIGGHCCTRCWDLEVCGNRVYDANRYKFTNFRKKILVYPFKTR